MISQIDWSEIIEEIIGGLVVVIIVALIGFLYRISPRFRNLFSPVYSFVATTARWVKNNFGLVAGGLLLVGATGGVLALTASALATVLVILLALAVVLLSRSPYKKRRTRILPLDPITTMDDFVGRYRSPPTGQTRFHKVPFLLNARYFETDANGPRQAELALSDPVERVSSVHLLTVAGNAWKRYEGVVIGRVQFLFNDGAAQETAFTLGQNVREWAPGNAPGRLAIEVNDHLSRLAWKGRGRGGTEAIIDHLEIPVRRRHGEKALEKIVFIRDVQVDTPENTLALAVFAITLEYWQ